ncbi:hypothetical protein CC79DRAFT_1357824 [Sarocladium strictum]
MVTFSLKVTTNNPSNTIRDSQFDITSAQQQLFQYYVERLSGILVNASGQGNPLRTLIIPLARTSPLLFQGVCAVSCIHRSGFMEGVQSRVYQNEAMGYYVRGLSSLKDLLPAALDTGQNRVVTPSSEQLILFQTLLLSAIFLCKFEIIKDGITNWRKHLDGVVSFYKWLESSHWAYEMPETMKFARSFITYHKGIACLTELGRRPTRDTEDFPKPIGYDFCSLEDLEQQSSGLQTVDPYMGFSQTLVILFRRVNNLLLIDIQDHNALPAVKTELLFILGRLSDKDWTAEHFLVPPSMTNDVVKCLEHISQAYEGAIYTCLHSTIEELVKRCKVYDRNKTMVREVEQLKAMIPVTKQDALERCLAGIQAVPCQSPEEAGLLPVLFVVACETDDPNHVAIVMQRLNVLEAHIGLGNIHSAVILLREILDRRARGRKRNDWRNLLAASSWDLIIT